LNDNYQSSSRDTTHAVLAPSTLCNHRGTLTGDSPDNGMFPGEHRQAQYRPLYLTAY
jgi:hypothetical protein